MWINLVVTWHHTTYLSDTVVQVMKSYTKNLFHIFVIREVITSAQRIEFDNETENISAVIVLG